MNKRLVGSLASSALTVAMLPAAVLAQTAPTAHINHLQLSDAAMSDPVEISALWAKQVGKADHALVTTSAVFADSLASGTFQGKHRAPLLFIDPARGLDAQTKATLKALGVSTVTILGGPQAIASALETELRTLDGIKTVNRLAGESRVETSVKLANETGAKDDTVIVARADDYADALAAGALGAKTGYPILLVPKPYSPGKAASIALHPEVETYLKDANIKKAIVAGGPQAVADETVDALRKLVPNTIRAAGESRRETALALANHWPGADGKVTLIEGYAQEHGFHNGFAAALPTANLNAPILLTNRKAAFTPAELGRYARSANDGVTGYCGTYVHDEMCRAAADHSHSNIRLVDITTNPTQPNTSGPAAPPPADPYVAPNVPQPYIPPNVLPPAPLPPPPEGKYGPEEGYDKNIRIWVGPDRLYGPGEWNQTQVTVEGLDKQKIYRLALAKAIQLPSGSIRFLTNLDGFPIVNRLGAEFDDGSALHLDTRSTSLYIQDVERATATISIAHHQSYGRIVPVVYDESSKQIAAVGAPVIVMPSQIKADIPLSQQFHAPSWNVVRSVGNDVIISDCLYVRTIPNVTSFYEVQGQEAVKVEDLTKHPILSHRLSPSDRILPGPLSSVHTQFDGVTMQSTVLWHNAHPFTPGVGVKAHNKDGQFTLVVSQVDPDASLMVRAAKIDPADPRDLNSTVDDALFTFATTISNVTVTRGVAEVTITGLEPGYDYDFAVTQWVGIETSKPGEFLWPIGPGLLPTPIPPCVTPPMADARIHEVVTYRDDRDQFIVRFIPDQFIPNAWDFKSGLFDRGTIDPSKIKVRAKDGTEIGLVNAGAPIDHPFYGVSEGNNLVGGVLDVEDSRFRAKTTQPLEADTTYTLVFEAGALTSHYAFPEFPAGTKSLPTEFEFKTLPK